MKISSSHINEK